MHFVVHMLCVKDSMVLIHLANAGLLEVSCDLFGKVAIPPLVYDEIKIGGKSSREDLQFIEEGITKKKIVVIPVKSRKLLEKANQFNIFRGEAEAVALYWQENAAWLATDDDNVRRKKDILHLNIIGTPAIFIRLIRDRKISKEKYLNAVKKLKERGWFSSTIFDVMFMEVS